MCFCACGGASANQNLSYGESAREAYNLAFADYEGGNCESADVLFRDIRRRYSYSRFAALAELRIADCMMKEKKYIEAIQAYRQFTRHRPSHVDVPYARFRIAEAYFKQVPDEFFLAPPPEERDQGPTRDALREARRFLMDFPENERVPEVRVMQGKCLSMLAKHELYAARFYVDRGHPQAGVLRLQLMLRSYRGSDLEPEALLLLGRTYLTLEDRSRAQRTFEDLIARFPESGFSTMARGYIRDLGLNAVLEPEAPPEQEEEAEEAAAPEEPDPWGQEEEPEESDPRPPIPAESGGTE